MGYFNDDYPLKEFNKDFYLSSGNNESVVYVFKFNKKGAFVEMKNKEPLAFVYPIIFTDDYNWESNNDTTMFAITGRNKNDVLTNIRNELERIKYGE